MAGRYVGFDRLKSELATRPGVKDPAALAASIGRKKYGAKRMARAAASGDRITEDDPRFDPRTMGNRRGRKDGPTVPTPDQQDRTADARQRQRAAYLNQPVGSRRGGRVAGDQRKTPRFS